MHTVKGVFDSAAFCKTLSAPMNSTNHALTPAGKCRRFDRSSRLHIFNQN